MSFCDDAEKQNLRLGKLSISKKNKSNLSRSLTITSMLQLNFDELTMMQYVYYLLYVHTKLPKPAICLQIIRIDIEVEYLCDNNIYHYPALACSFL